MCRAHRRSKDEIILDFGVEIEFEGCLQICEFCIAEAAKITGVVEAATEALQQELALERVRREMAEDELDRAMTALDALRAAPAPRVRKPAAKADSGD